MSRKFIATILAASLAITTVAAAPARADNDDLARFLVGTTALFIIGSALSDNNRQGAQTRNNNPTPPSRGHTPHQPHSQPYGQPYTQPHNPRNTQPTSWPRQDTAELPRGCMIGANTSQGYTRVFGARCLNTHYAQANRIPRACRTEIWDQDGRRPGYTARCLRDHGFRTNRR